MAILEVKNLKKNFGELEVLKGIDFSLEKGDVMAVIGSSGNGKTTLLRCINFLETPNEGEIIVNGNNFSDLTALSERFYHTFLCLIPACAILAAG